MKLQITESPSIPRYSVLVGDAEVWNCNCASNSVSQTLRLAAEMYPGEEIIMFDDPRHYSNR